LVGLELVAGTAEDGRTLREASDSWVGAFGRAGLGLASHALELRNSGPDGGNAAQCQAFHRDESQGQGPPLEDISAPYQEEPAVPDPFRGAQDAPDGSTPGRQPIDLLA